MPTLTLTRWAPRTWITRDSTVPPGGSGVPFSIRCSSITDGTASPPSDVRRSPGRALLLGLVASFASGLGGLVGHLARSPGGLVHDRVQRLGRLLSILIRLVKAFVDGPLRLVREAGREEAHDEQQHRCDHDDGDEDHALILRAVSPAHQLPVTGTADRLAGARGGGRAGTNRRGHAKARPP